MPSQNATRIRRRLELRGQVQGVGFRPYVYRLACELGLAGHVANDGQGVIIEIEGGADRVATFEARLVDALPPLARITQQHAVDAPPTGERVFAIRPSAPAAARRPEVTPDAATCEDCRRELGDPADRRYRYPFINCTNCGPRYSIIRTVPYDRPATTMAAFEMCPPCAREYADPADRRFHAQPNACPNCGPRLELRSGPAAGPAGAAAHDPLRAAARLLADGHILAIKGIGGFHLACRADCAAAVQRLRARKLRDGKPLALMVPSEQVAERLCQISPADRAALRCPAGPIVLAPQRPGHGLAAEIAPGCHTFGLMLPYAPLHHLLFAEGLGPLVMTSANLAGQPLTYRDEDAFRELRDVADAFLTHDREIFRPIDDSVVFTFRDATIPIRRARGYAPRPLRLALPVPARTARILAVGGELKATVCLLDNGAATVSEHLGDLTSPEAYRHFTQAIARLGELLAFEPDIIAHDLHPSYLSTQYARNAGLPVVAWQHHHAHIAAVLAECNEAGPVVGIACDGTGYGPDGAVWGGEILLCERERYERLAHLAYFPLVGGDLAAIETWRPAAALLRQAFGSSWREYLAAGAGAPSTADLDIFERQAAAGLNAPPSSSLGRVFDAVSFLLGRCPRNRHEAEAALAVESAAGDLTAGPLPYEIDSSQYPVQLSLLPAIAAIARSRRAGAAPELLAARFHETAAALLADAAAGLAQARGLRTAALSGGCFANRRLLAGVVARLEARGLRVCYHRTVPSGDGGLSLGQAALTAWQVAGR